MKRLLLIFSCVLCALVTWADTTYTLTLNNAATQSTTGYFTVNTGGGFNTKYTGKYNGVEYTKGLKINSSSSITFSNTGTATVVIVQSTSANGTNQFKFDGNLVATTAGVDNPNEGDVTVREYTLTSIAAGTHTITNGTETGLLYVSVTEAAASSPTVKTMPLSATYALGTANATPLAVEVNMVDATNNHLEYQWYVNSTNSTDGGTAIAEATNANYTPNITAVGVLYYYCVIVEKDANENQIGNPAVTNTVEIEVIAHVDDPQFVEVNGTVELSCETTSAAIYYSIDNGTTWIEYTRPFTILDNDVTVLAKAQVGGGTLTSEIVSYDVEAVKAKSGSSSIVLYYDATNNFSLDENGEGQADAALVGKDGTEYEGWTIQVTGTGKTISYGTAINEKTTIKGSNGRQMSILMPPGVCANRITLYSYVNAEQTTDKVYWKEVAGVNYSTNSIAMASWSDAANPDVRVYPLDDLEDEMTFNNAGRQLCFYAVIDYTIVNGYVSLNSEGYATYSGEENVYVSGAQAYTCVLNDDKTTIDAQPIASNVVPAYNGVLLYGKPNTTATLIYQSSAEALGTNGLKPTTTANGLQPLEVALALNGNEFNLYTGSEFVSNKAYFPWSDSSQAKGITINFLDMIDEGDANAIDAATVEEETTTGVKKAVVNGQLVIKSANGIFNMAGARIK